MCKALDFRYKTSVKGYLKSSRQVGTMLQGDLVRVMETQTLLQGQDLKDGSRCQAHGVREDHNKALNRKWQLLSAYHFS